MKIECAADFADWYDTEARRHSDEFLTAFVHENPNVLGIYVASFGANVYDVGSMFFVDVGRLGIGMAGGSAGGFFQDILRALSVIPIGKVAVVGKPLIAKFIHGLTSFFHWSKVSGAACVPISLAKALQATGQQLYIPLEAAAGAMGRSLGSINLTGAYMSELRMGLNSLKAHYDELVAGSAKTWSDIVLYAENFDGVIIMSLERFDNVAIKGHAIMVSKTANGVKIFDRSGIFNSLDELSRAYGIRDPKHYYVIQKADPLFFVRNWRLDPALAIKLNSMGPLGAVIVRSAVFIGFNPNVSAESVAKTFQKYVSDHAALYPPPVQPPPMDSLMYTHTIIGPRILESDWLSNIAKKWYGDVLLWPILFDYNRGPDFQDPNKMYVGQRVKVPFIRDKSAADIAYYRNRGRTWR